jgi:Flp pilus assembly protein TadD
MSKPKVQRKIITQKKKKSDPLHQKKVMPLRPSTITLIISLCLIVVTLTVFWQVQQCQFLSFDDDDYVTDNPNVKAGLTFKGVTWAFTTFHASNWHPLTWLSHMLDCELFGLNPRWHHLTNLLFHILNTLLLFLVLKRMTGAPWGSSFVAALFALHPLHVESVAWVAERKDVLSTFFWMLTMWAYIRYVERPGINRYLVVLIFCAMGLMSKPIFVTLPFVLLLLDYWPLGRLPFGQSGDHRLKYYALLKSSDSKSIVFGLVLEKIPLFVLVVISSVLTFFAQQKGGTVKTIQLFPFEDRIANALLSYVGYIGKMIWPHHLGILYPYPNEFPFWGIAGAGLLLVGISVLVICAVLRYPYLLVGWLWYLGTLVPVIGLVQVGMQSMADRYTYLPFIGLFIIIAKGIPDILATWSYRKMVLVISAGVLLFIFMIVTRYQIQHWQNNMTLFQHTVNVTSNNFLIHNKLGNLLTQQGKFNEATHHYYEALRINPNFVESHNNIGNALFRQGKIEEAISHYRKALENTPHYADAHNNLGVALARQGKFQEATIHFSEALRINSDFAEAHNNLGVLLAQQGETQKAKAHFTEAVRIRPDYAEAHFYLGLTYLMMGNRDLALREYQILKTINPDLANTLSQNLLK